MSNVREPGTVDLSLNKKALNFIVAAIDFQLAALSTRLESGLLSEDDESEIGNDHQYLLGLRETIAAAARVRTSEE